MKLYSQKIAFGVSALMLMASHVNAAPIVYTDEALYLSDLTSLGYSTISESFENDSVWANSRNSISSPGSTPSVTSQGIVWSSNYTENNIATGDVGGSAPDGSFAIYSLAHGMTTDSGVYCDSAEDPNIPIECYQNDGLKVESETGDTLFAFGGRVDSNTGTPKITFLLDGIDINANNSDNIDNWQREGDLANNWSFIGVIDTDGFLSAELLELKGKDYQQVLVFSDDYTIGVSAVPVLSLSSVPAGVTAGIYASALVSDTGRITYSEFINSVFGVSADNTHTYSELFDFIVTGVTDKAQIQVTLVSPIPTNAVYRKYDSNTNTWITLVSDIKNKIASAAKVAGSCPPVGHELYDHLNGLVEGDECFQITIEDNTGSGDGIYDSDFTTGIIAHPGGVAVSVPEPEPTSPPATGGGGGAVGLLGIVLFSLIGFARRKKV